MKKILTCIVCPNGCQLSIDDTSLEVNGNKCPRGLSFAIEELTNPQRSVSSTVKTSLPEYPVVAVRTDGAISKSKITDLIKLLKEIVLKDYLPIGSIIIHNIFGTDTNVITTTDMHKGDFKV